MSTLSPSAPYRLAVAALALGILGGCATDRTYDDGYYGGGYIGRDYYEPPYYAPHVHYYDYWYYPHAGFYYDPSVRIYIYREHDRWVRARRLPRHLHAYPGGHVIVRAPRDRPYADYPRHRDRYQPDHYKPDRAAPDRYRPGPDHRPHYTPPPLQRGDRAPVASDPDPSPMDRLRDRQRPRDDPRDRRYDGPVSRPVPEHRSPPAAVQPGGAPAPGQQAPRRQPPKEPESRQERRGPPTPVAPAATQAPGQDTVPRDAQWRKRFIQNEADVPGAARNPEAPAPKRRWPGPGGRDDE